MIQVMGVESLEEVVSQFRTAQKGKLPSCAHITNITKFDQSQRPTVIQKYLPEWLAPKGMNILRIETLAPYNLSEGSWDTLKDQYSEQIRNLLNEYAPNMKDAQSIREYAYPPIYIEMKFPSMKKGSIKHGEYMSTQMGFFRPNDQCSQYRTPIDGYYVCGAGVYPGGMVLLGNGYGAAQVITEDLKLTPWWQTPEYIATAIEKGLVI
jgi:phytoene dehydrogenase-like protein